MYPFNYEPFVNENSSAAVLWAEVLDLRKEVENQAKVAGQFAARIEALLQGFALDKKPILIVTSSALNESDVQALEVVWRGIVPDGHVFGFPDQMDVTTLDDDDLASMGLARVGPQQATDRDLYDANLLGFTRR